MASQRPDSETRTPWRRTWSAVAPDWHKKGKIGCLRRRSRKRSRAGPQALAQWGDSTGGFLNVRYSISQSALGMDAGRLQGREMPARGREELDGTMLDVLGSFSDDFDVFVSENTPAIAVASDGQFDPLLRQPAKKGAPRDTHAVGGLSGPVVGNSSTCERHASCLLSPCEGQGSVSYTRFANVTYRRIAP